MRKETGEYCKEDTLQDGAGKQPRSTTHLLDVDDTRPVDDGENRGGGAGQATGSQGRETDVDLEDGGGVIEQEVDSVVIVSEFLVTPK